MKTGLKLSLVCASLLACGFAYSQGLMGGQCAGMSGQNGGMRHERMGKMDPTRMQAKVEQRNAALKTKLKITAAQETAWSAYTEAMKPGAGMSTAQCSGPAEMAKLTTPERLEKMQALHTQHMGEMNAALEKHMQATKALYAVLTAEQQKVFDAEAMPGQFANGAEKKGSRSGTGAMSKKQG